MSDDDELADALHIDSASGDVYIERPLRETKNWTQTDAPIERRIYAHDGGGQTSKVPVSKRLANCNF